VRPSRRGRAVDVLQERLELSQRRAGAIVGQHRSTQHHERAEPDPDRGLRDRLRRFRPPSSPGGGIGEPAPCCAGRVTP
jgi:hypothetical protein